MEQKIDKKKLESLAAEWLMEDESLEDLQNGYYLIQKKDGFRFGVDAVLLADFAKIKKGEKVLEMGSGTGIIPILLATRYNPSKIEAIEIQEPFVEMGNRSLKLNKFDGFVKINHLDLKEGPEFFGKAVFDVVVTNPPYMKAESGINCPQEERNIACFEVKCTIDDVVSSAKELLRSGGRFYMVHRADRLVDIVFAMRNAGLEPKRIRFVQSKPRSKPHLILICGVRSGGPELKVEEPLIIYEEDGSYTEEILRIYGRSGQIER